MFTQDDVEKEIFDGEIGTLLKRIQKILTHTHGKTDLLSNLITLCKSKGYITFSGSAHRMFIGRVGQSYLYDVPIDKTGHLRKFRGKKIRVICSGSGRLSDRVYMAGEL